LARKIFKNEEIIGEILINLSNKIANNVDRNITTPNSEKKYNLLLTISMA